jgi:hypothetical protein
MTDERKTRKQQIENLDLNKETLQDLTEEHTEGVQGGRRAGAPRPSEPSCDAGCE